MGYGNGVLGISWSTGAGPRMTTDGAYRASGASKWRVFWDLACHFSLWQTIGISDAWRFAIESASFLTFARMGRDGCPSYECWVSFCSCGLARVRRRSAHGLPRLLTGVLCHWTCTRRRGSTAGPILSSIVSVNDDCGMAANGANGAGRAFYTSHGSEATTCAAPLGRS